MHYSSRKRETNSTCRIPPNFHRLMPPSFNPTFSHNSFISTTLSKLRSLYEQWPNHESPENFLNYLTSIHMNFTHSTSILQTISTSIRQLYTISNSKQRNQPLPGHHFIYSSCQLFDFEAFDNCLSCSQHTIYQFDDNFRK